LKNHRGFYYRIVTQKVTKRFAYSIAKHQNPVVPVNNVSESIAVASNSPQLSSWSVWNRDGIFYAIVPLHGGESPLEVALHGVRSESEAQEALALLAYPRCMLARVAN
jgi:hypothetical protein